jgi:hypothetical protein
VVTLCDVAGNWFEILLSPCVTYASMQADHWPFTYSAVSPVHTHLRCEFLKKIITSKNFLAEFVLALCVVFKKYLFMSCIGKVSFIPGQTINCNLPVNCGQLFGRSQPHFGLYKNLFCTSI